MSMMRKPIDISGVEVKIEGNKVSYKGKESSGEYILPDYIIPKIEDNKLHLDMQTKTNKLFRENKKFWGLHRALLSNSISGSRKPFEKKVQITGLGYKVQVAGSKLNFSLGYSHKIDLELPKGVTLEVDKPGQALTFRSADKNLLGDICDKVRSLRPTEPYKGTGIKFSDEIIIRKAGKSKK